MQEEVFGPMLSIKTYESLDQVIDFVNSKPRPLALYYFGKDKGEIESLCQRCEDDEAALHRRQNQNV
jgi:coniferyl-aldehyde dehydrogenase